MVMDGGQEGTTELGEACKACNVDTYLRDDLPTLWWEGKQLNLWGERGRPHPRFRSDASRECFDVLYSAGHSGRRLLVRSRW